MGKKLGSKEMNIQAYGIRFWLLREEVKEGRTEGRENIEARKDKD